MNAITTATLDKPEILKRMKELYLEVARLNVEYSTFFAGKPDNARREEKRRYEYTLDAMQRAIDAFTGWAE